MTHFLVNRTSIVVLLLLILSSQANAEPPILQASGPIIHLADNLDEENRLGWCIDTIGRGLSEVLHTRACSPDDDSTERDFSFIFDTESGRIESVTFAGKCITVNQQGSEHDLGLFDCEPHNTAQKFIYRIDQMAFHPNDNEKLCISAAQSSVDHGRFQSRAIDLQVCDEVESPLREWLIKTD